MTVRTKKELGGTSRMNASIEAGLFGDRQKIEALIASAWAAHSRTSACPEFSLSFFQRQHLSGKTLK